MTTLDRKENLARYQRDLANKVEWLVLDPPYAELLHASEVFFRDMNQESQFPRKILLCYWHTDAPADQSLLCRTDLFHRIAKSPT